MAIDWSALNTPPNPASQHADEYFLRRMTERAMAQSAANEAALNKAKTDEKKRRLAEDRQATEWLASEVERKGR